MDSRMIAIASVYFFSFMGMGIFHPFINLHFARIGLSGSMIGLIAAVLPLGGIFGPPLHGTFVDARGRAGKTVATAILAAAAVYAVAISTDIPWVILVAMFLFGMLFRSVPPLVDAAALAHLARSKGSYGRLRLWGSLGFMLAVVSFGFLAQRYGIRPLLGLYVVTSIIAAGCAFKLPETEQAPVARGLFAGLKGLSGTLFSRNFRRFAGVLVLGQLADVTHNTFFSVYMDQLGLAESVTGLAWAVGVAAEVIVLWHVDRLLDRFGTRAVITFGFACAAVRWVITATVADPAVIIAIQALHGFTFGAVYAGMVRFVALEAPPGSQATGQALITGARAALAGVVGSSLVGVLSDVWSIKSLYVASSVLSLMAAVLLVATVHDPRSDAFLSSSAKC